jgi:hypothetical protein
VRNKPQLLLLGDAPPVPLDVATKYQIDQLSRTTQIV